MSSSKSSFFRQSGWMVIATVGGGVFMSAVHTVAGDRMHKDEYSAFYVLLRVFILLGIPAAGLQTVFAQQAAAALTKETVRALSETTRTLLRATFFTWLVIGVLILFASKEILALLKISNPAALWLTVFMGLTTLWLPIFKGLLQGKHHFAGLGWISILDGVGRFAAVSVIILFFHEQAAGGIFGCFIGQIGAAFLGIWLTRDIWRGEGCKFQWKPWLGQVIPLTLAFGGILFICSTDSIFVQSVFTQEDTRRLYMAANLTGFAAMQFIAPITAVMFPSIVRSLARSEKTDVMKLTMGITLAVGGTAALICTLFPSLPLRVIYFNTPAMWEAAPLVPWFAWALLPLTTSNVLVANLMARRKFEIAPWLALIAVAFASTLIYLKPALLQLPQFRAFQIIVITLGAYSLLLCVVVSWFTWGRQAPIISDLDPAPEAVRLTSDRASSPAAKNIS